MTEKTNINLPANRPKYGQNECQMNVMQWRVMKGYYSEGQKCSTTKLKLV